MGRDRLGELPQRLLLRSITRAEKQAAADRLPATLVLAAKQVPAQGRRGGELACGQQVLKRVRVARRREPLEESVVEAASEVRAVVLGIARNESIQRCPRPVAGQRRGGVGMDRSGIEEVLRVRRVE